MYRQVSNFFKRRLINLDSIVNKELDFISISKMGEAISVLEIGPGSKNVYDKRYLKKTLNYFF